MNPVNLTPLKRTSHDDAPITISAVTSSPSPLELAWDGAKGLFALIEEASKIENKIAQAQRELNDANSTFTSPAPRNPPPIKTPLQSAKRKVDKVFLASERK